MNNIISEFDIDLTLFGDPDDPDTEENSMIGMVTIQSSGSLSLTLTINTIPSNAIVRVKIDNEWIIGKEHIVEPGIYEYEVSLEGYETKTGYIEMEDEDKTILVTLIGTNYQATFIVTPIGAIVKVNIADDVWITGMQHHLEPGSYIYRVYADGYNTKEGIINITNEDRTVYVNLDITRHNLIFYTTPYDAVVEVNIDGEWTRGKDFPLLAGNYNYRVYRTGYRTTVGTIHIVDKDVTFDIHLIGKQESGKIIIDDDAVELIVNLDNI